ncbi:hypothetical protein EDB86DRAFT_2838736 [Lactarius hatsudake]|nr:hypothetical protein EDB86DRAFT_2838736 [Lactarius hatsudake]
MTRQEDEGLAPSTTGLEQDFLATLRGVNWTVNFLATLHEVTVTVTTVAGLYTRGRRWFQSYFTITRIVQQDRLRSVRPSRRLQSKGLFLARGQGSGIPGRALTKRGSVELQGQEREKWQEKWAIFENKTETSSPM